MNFLFFNLYFSGLFLYLHLKQADKDSLIMASNRKKPFVSTRGFIFKKPTCHLNKKGQNSLLNH